MNRLQAVEAFTLFTAVRHVDEMNSMRGVSRADTGLPGCVICEGVRHGLYTEEECLKEYLSGIGFASHFGCTAKEAARVIFHSHLVQGSNITTGENYFQAGKELLEKYGYGDLFNDSPETTLFFSALMDELKQPVVA